MRHLLPLLALAAASACQPAAPATRADTVAAPALAPARDTASARRLVPPVPVAPVQVAADSLTPAMRQVLGQVNLAPLFLAPGDPGGTGFKSVLDGFFGHDPQRFSMAILQARRDSLRPEVIHIVGKTRYRQDISSFKGEIRLTRLADYYDQGMLLSQGDELVPDTVNDDGRVPNARAYAVTGDFRCVGQAPAAYVLAGQVLLDCWVRDDGTVGTMYSPEQGVVLRPAATKGSGLMMCGSWQAAGKPAARPFLVSGNVFLLAPAIIRDFGIGSRGSEVNPRYARAGWSTYWENDEWWADAPRPQLNL